MDPNELKSIPLFASLGTSELRVVAQQADTVDVPAGKRLATEGGFAYEFFVIEAGTAEVSRDGKALTTLVPGDFFGEIGLLETERRTASVVATSPMRLVVLTGSQFRAIEHDTPAVAGQIRKAIEQRLEADRRTADAPATHDG